MFRDFLSSRALHVGFVLFVLLVGGTQLYSWHVRRGIKVDEARTQQFLQQREIKKETRTAQDAGVPTDTETLGETEMPLETDDMPAMSEETKALPIDDTDEFFREETAEEEADDEAILLSTFGPYPEVPDDYPEYLTPFWVRNPTGAGVPHHAAGPFELMDRVLIKLWKQGRTDITGASTSEGGKIYPHYTNVAYVRYKEDLLPDGTVHRFVTRIKGGPEIAPFGRQIRDGNTPAHIQLVDYDGAGIDPYTFLKTED